MWKAISGAFLVAVIFGVVYNLMRDEVFERKPIISGSFEGEIIALENVVTARPCPANEIKRALVKDKNGLIRCAISFHWEIKKGAKVRVCIFENFLSNGQSVPVVLEEIRK